MSAEQKSDEWLWPFGARKPQSLKDLAIIALLAVAFFAVLFTINTDQFRYLFTVGRDGLEQKIVGTSPLSSFDFFLCIDDFRPRGLGLQTKGPAVEFTYENEFGALVQAYVLDNRVRKTRLEFEKAEVGTIYRFYAEPDRDIREGELQHLNSCAMPKG